MNTDKHLALFSRHAALDVQRVLAPNITSATSAIDLLITLPAEDLNVRDLSRFFLLVDRAYGRLLYGDLRRYAWDEVSQLRISRIQAGSWEVVLSHILHLIPDPTAILILYALLKLLPKAFRESAEGVLKLSTAYNNYEQAQLARANRKALRDKMDKDEELRHLSPLRKKQLAEIIDGLVREDPSISNPALDFAANSFLSVTIRLRTPKEDQRP